MAKTSRNDYRLVLNAYINEQKINEQLDKISKNRVFNIKLKFDMTDIKKQVDDLKKELEKVKIGVADPTSGGGKGTTGKAKIPLFDKKTNDDILDGIKKKIQEIETSAVALGQKVKESFSTKTDALSGENLNKSVIEFTDKAGRAVQVTTDWKTNAQGITTAYEQSTRYVDDIGKAEKLATQETQKREREAKKLKDHYQKIQNFANTFLEKSKSLDQSNPMVKEGVGLSNRIVELTGLGRPLSDIESKELETAKNRLTVLDGAVRASGKNLQSWSTEINLALKRTLEWATAMKIVYEGLHQLQQGVQYIRELDKEMTNIQAVSGATKEEVYDLAQNYNELAKSLKVSTLEVARGSLEYIRQGKSLKETEELLKSTTILSKLGNTDMAQSTEYLTSIMNAYKLDVEDTMSVVDRLVSVDNAASTSVQELASAMQRTAVTAQQTGVDMNSLIAYIGTVSAVSRKSSESIGESLLHAIVYLN